MSIPPLDDNELGAAGNSDRRLSHLFDAFPTSAKDLLRIPFNLWLLEQIGLSGDKAYVSGIHTATELLSLFWERRVKGEGSAELNETVLRRVVSDQVRTKQLVSIKSNVYEIGLDEAWNRMFSCKLLEEDQGTKNGVKFSHNILFDFAVATLLIADDPGEIAAFLSVDPARPLFLRPSLVYHFEDQFHRRPKRFWESYFSLCVSGTPAMTPVTRLILPTVLVSEGRTWSDFTPLLEALVERRQEGISATSYFLQALRAVAFDSSQTVPARKYALWSELLREISQRIAHPFAWDVGWINNQILTNEEKGRCSTDVVGTCNIVARALLTWCWEKRQYDGKDWNYRIASAWAIPQICRSYGAAIEESRAAIQQVLSLINEPDFPIDLVYAVCSNIEPVVNAEPGFAGQIYRKVFGYCEESEERTQIGGPVLPMFSDRRQDYDMCMYNLLEAFPHYVEIAPEEAISAGMAALEASILQDHVAPYLNPGIALKDLYETFLFQEREATYIQDGSHIWDRGSYPDSELKIAHEIDILLVHLADTASRADFERAFNAYIDGARIAFFWKRLLETGCERPEFFARYLHDLSLAYPILLGADTTFISGKFIEIAFPFWSSEQRRQVEEVILAIPEQKRDVEDPKAYLRRRRNRLLGCIPEAFIQTPKGSALRRELDNGDAPLRNEPLVTFESTQTPISDSQFLKHQGAQIETPKNAKLRELTESLDRLASQIGERAPTEEEASTIIAAAEALSEEIFAIEAEADPKVSSHAVTRLATTARTLIRNFKQLSRNQIAFLRTVLFRAATHPDPKPDRKRDSEWESASWSPWPRNEAAQGLRWLLLIDPADSEAKDWIRKLAEDPVPSVRFLVATELFRLSNGNSELMHSIMAQRVEEEVNLTVLDGLCCSIHNTIHLPRSREFVRRLCEKIGSDPEHYDYHSDVIAMVADIAVRELEPWSNELLLLWVSDPAERSFELFHCSGRLLQYLEPTTVEDVLSRALSFQESLVRTTLEHLLYLHTLTSSEIDERIKDTAQRLYRLIDQTVLRLYLAFNFKESKASPNRLPSPDQRRAFFFRIRPVLELIVAFGTEVKGRLLAPTAHHFMELLSGALEYDVNEVLRLACRVARGGAKGNYHFDSLAINEVVTLVERILADFRGALREEEAFRDLLELLDIFASAGWPEALRLVWRLDEVYR